MGWSQGCRPGTVAAGEHLRDPAGGSTSAPDLDEAADDGPDLLVAERRTDEAGVDAPGGGPGEREDVEAPDRGPPRCPPAE
ncbi:MAG: hypothetical protein RLZZ272_65, partial [Actinomycetota bacterium]